MKAGQRVKRTHIGIELVRLLASEGDRIFSTDRARELAHRVGLKDSYLWEALYHLRRNGWIVPLRRGLYALSSTVPGVSPVHEFEVAMALVDPAAIAYWSAVHYHGMTEQAPRHVFVLTTNMASVPRIRGDKVKQDDRGFPVGDTTYFFVQVKPERYFGTDKVWIGEARVTITDPERTLIDGLIVPQYCGGFAEVLHAFELRGVDLNLQRIIDYSLKLDTATAKRLGWVLEQQSVEPSKLERLASLPINGFRRLDRTGPRRGPYNRRWMIQENLPGKVHP